MTLSDKTKCALAAAFALVLPAPALAAPPPYSVPCYRPALHNVPGLVCYDDRQPPIVCGPGGQCHSWPMPCTRTRCLFLPMEDRWTY